VVGYRLRRRDDRGSIPIALLLTLVSIGLSAILVAVVTAQFTTTRVSVQRVHALHAAQAGIDVALGQLRAANGELAKLPCRTTESPLRNPFTGRVGAGGTARYEVGIDYFTTDPQGKDDAWLTANRLSCSAGAGTFNTPGFALLRSRGTDDSRTWRNLRATYTVQTSNQNIVGGLVHVFRTATSSDMCFDAGSSSPSAGTNLQMQLCSAGSSRQQFAYNPNLTLTLVSSKTRTIPLGMCLDAGTPHAIGSVVQFRPCADTTKPQQQWSINDSANFEGTTDGRTLDGYCFNVQSPNTPGSFVVLGRGSQCNRAYDNVQAFSPEATTGAGASGSDAGQLVNFDQFGRCVDVTEQNVGYAYLIVWPCKQAPDPTNVSWNQKYTLPAIPDTATNATGRIFTTWDGVRYCLQSPVSTAAGRYVQVNPCPVTTPAKMTWTIYGDTGTYTTGYRIIDNAGYCLSPTDPEAATPDLYPSGQQISKLIVAPCTGSTLQKWNAPPNILQSTPLKDIREQ
jgi:hypothetical protein